MVNLRGKSGIYVYTFPNGKRYVGQSLDLIGRLKNYRADVRGTGKDSDRPVILAIRKYGWENIKIEYPFTIDRYSVDEVDLSIILDILEMKYIREYQTFRINGYNLSEGADSTLFSQHTSTSILNNTIMKENYKPILLYDKSGCFMKEYESVSACAYDLHLSPDEITKYANCRKYMRNTYIVKYKKGDSIPDKIIPYSLRYKEEINIIYKTIEVEIEKPICSWRKRQTPILQYGLDGNFIQEWESISSASRSIGSTVSLKSKTSQGYIWIKKESNDIPKVIDTSKLTIQKQRACNPRISYDSKYSSGIVQKTLDGEVINKFKSMREASIITGIGYNHIWSCLKKRIKNPTHIWCMVG